MRYALMAPAILAALATVQAYDCQCPKKKDYAAANMVSCKKPDPTYIPGGYLGSDIPVPSTDPCIVECIVAGDNGSYQYDPDTNACAYVWGTTNGLVPTRRAARL